MLELRVAFLAWLVVLTVLVEPLNRKPGARGAGLPGLGVEAPGKRVVGGKSSTVALQIVLARSSRIHPQAQALVADKLDHPDGFIDGSVLGPAPV